MSKHTPEPWNWTSETNEKGKLTGNQIVYDNDENLGYRYRVVALLPKCKNKKTTRANAMLIAAAPEMLEALKTALGYLKSIDTKEPDTIGALAGVEAHLKFYIDRAEGKE